MKQQNKSEVVEIFLEEGAFLPTKEFDSSIGFDLAVSNDVVIPPGRSIVNLHFRVKLPQGMGAYIFGRSGMSAKGLKGHNIYDNNREKRFDCDVMLGLIDPNYKGEVGVIVNNRDERFMLKRGDSIAQMVFMNCASPVLKVVKDFSLDGERGEQGFNS